MQYLGHGAFIAPVLLNFSKNLTTLSEHLIFKNAAWHEQNEICSQIITVFSAI